jgi:hypothetical protein
MVPEQQGRGLRAGNAGAAGAEISGFRHFGIRYIRYGFGESDESWVEGLSSRNHLEYF